MEFMKERLKKLIDKIQEVSDMVYQQKLSDAFQNFSILLNELTVITDQLFILHSQAKLGSFDDQSYLRTLTEAMNALEARDDVLLADILSYDLKEQIETIIKQL